MSLPGHTVWGFCESVHLELLEDLLWVWEQLPLPSAPDLELQALVPTRDLREQRAAANAMEELLLPRPFLLHPHPQHHPFHMLLEPI